MYRAFTFMGVDLHMNVFVSHSLIFYVKSNFALFALIKKIFLQTPVEINFKHNYIFFLDIWDKQNEVKNENFIYEVLRGVNC